MRFKGIILSVLFCATFYFSGAFSPDSLKARAEHNIVALEHRANLVDTMLANGQLIPEPLYREFQIYTDSLSMLYSLMGSLIKEEKSVKKRTVLRAKLSGSMSQLRFAIDYADLFRKEKIEPNLDR